MTYNLIFLLYNINRFLCIIPHCISENKIFNRISNPNKSKYENFNRSAQKILE